MHNLYLLMHILNVRIKCFPLRAEFSIFFQVITRRVVNRVKKITRQKKKKKKKKAFLEKNDFLLLCGVAFPNSRNLFVLSKSV